MNEIWIIDLSQINIEDIQGKFDSIVCADVIEHPLHPEPFLSVIHSKGLINGKLILSIPNLRHWSVFLLLIVDDRFNYTNEGLIDKTHVHLFTYTEIKLMLSRCGYKLLSTNINFFKQKLSQDILDKLLKSISQLGGDQRYAKNSIVAYQFIIDAILIFEDK